MASHCLSCYRNDNRLHVVPGIRQTDALATQSKGALHSHRILLAVHTEHRGVQRITVSLGIIMKRRCHNLHISQRSGISPFPPNRTIYRPNRYGSHLQDCVWAVLQLPNVHLDAAVDRGSRTDNLRRLRFHDDRSFGTILTGKRVIRDKLLFVFRRILDLFPTPVPLSNMANPFTLPYVGHLRRHAHRCNEVHRDQPIDDRISIAQSTRASRKNVSTGRHSVYFLRDSQWRIQQDQCIHRQRPLSNGLHHGGPRQRIHGVRSQHGFLPDK